MNNTYVYPWRGITASDYIQKENHEKHPCHGCDYWDTEGFCMLGYKYNRCKLEEDDIKGE